MAGRRNAYMTHFYHNLLRCRTGKCSPRSFSLARYRHPHSAPVRALKMKTAGRKPAVSIVWPASVDDDVGAGDGHVEVACRRALHGHARRDRAIVDRDDRVAEPVVDDERSV